MEDKRDLPLDLIGIRQATDKSSLTGDYLRHYEAMFRNLRDESFNLLEIGVLRGASTRMWEQFFSRARIIGVDIDPHCKSYESGRVTIEIGSQTDPTFLHHLATTYNPRVIIDDGSHKSYDVIFTFERLFPTLMPGGTYIIEDLHFHLLEAEAERLRGGSPVLATEYVTDLVQCRLGSASYLQGLTGIRRHIVASIDRIEIISQAAIFHKKLSHSDSKARLKDMRPHVEAAKDSRVWFYYSQRLLESGGDLQDVADALRRAITINPKVGTYQRLSETMERLGDRAAAIEALEQALTIVSGNSTLSDGLRARITRLQTGLTGQQGGH